jgi:OOP family OmpA-OmpF porin
MNRKKSFIWNCLALLAGAGFGDVPGVHAADEPAWYAGAGVGRANATKTTSWAQTNDATQLTGGFTSSTLIDSHGTAWKLFGGYQFNETLALEAGYHELGRYTGSTTVTAPAASVGTGNWDASAVSIAAVATFPVVNRLSGFVKGGLAATRLNVNFSGPVSYSRNETRVQPLLGLGVKFDFNKQFGVRGEIERFNNVGDGSTTGQTPINVFSVSGQYRF